MHYRVICTKPLSADVEERVVSKASDALILLNQIGGVFPVTVHTMDGGVVSFSDLERAVLTDERRE